VAEDAPYEDLPVLSKGELPSEWQSEYPVLCVAGRSFLDEAAAIMLGQLSTAHGLAARVEGAEALSTANIFRLETIGVAVVCWSIWTRVAQLTCVTPFAVFVVSCQRRQLFWVAG